VVRDGIMVCAWKRSAGQKCGKWNPGIQNRKIVNSLKSQAIHKMNRLLKNAVSEKQQRKKTATFDK
jgi:hypothetical protein